MKKSLVHTYAKLIAVLVLSGMSIPSLNRIAMAGGAPTAEELADQCGATIMELYSDHQDRIDLQYDEAQSALTAAAISGATPAQLMKLASTHATRIEKDAFKAASQMEKTINKCLAKLERLGADPPVIEEVEDLLEGAGAARSDSTEAIDGVAGIVGALLAG